MRTEKASEMDKLIIINDNALREAKEQERKRRDSKRDRILFLKSRKSVEERTTNEKDRL